MTKQLEFFYDYVSPYSYLANTQLSQLKADVVYRPVLLGALLKSIGSNPPAKLAPRGDYMFRDVARWASHYDIPYAMNPAFPVNTIKALRVALVALENDCLGQIHQALFDAVWAQQLDVDDEEVLTRIVADSGMVPDAVLQRIADGEIKDQLRANTEEAISRGVFGAPTFFVDGEMYFGNDRLHFIEAALDTL